MVWHAFMLNPRTYTNFASASPGITDPVLKEYPGRSCFAILLADTMKFDLAAAVHRQRRFALKIIEFGWVHSPVADFILARAVDRYGKFLSLFEAQRATTGTGVSNGRVGMVPTLDIDLVWHTHQLSPASYRAASSTVTSGHLVNHDDTISRGAAKFGFMATAQLYRDRFNEEYDLCSSCLCQTARLRRSGTARATALPLYKQDLGVIQNMIAVCASNRKSQLGLSVDLDFAGCQCQTFDTAEDTSSKRSCCDRSAICLCDATSYSGCNGCNSDCSGE
ncbi:Protein of unknown function (DUF1399) domain containing protein [Rhypophila sp. PSN 637]